MQPLDKNLRTKLEQTVKNARDIAELATRAALDQLGISEPVPLPHLSETERELHRTLRAHGRQLGDLRAPDTEVQEIGRLIEEVAYEHWHRMLFARFLAENNLLMYPDPVAPVPISLEECEDLAKDEGAKNGWELASRFAARMLPQIFRPDSPVFQLVLPPEHEQKLENLIAQLPQEVFIASDSLGWVYQFWQAKKKNEINDLEVKIGARELPAVTQLFTEPYMVSFLLDNSLGAWWAMQRLSNQDLIDAESEIELRRKAALPDVPLDYLRFIKDKDGKWVPATGFFDNWPKHLGDIKILDPCCGSGHFLVTIFMMLVPMRMELERLSSRDAVNAVLHENIYGLEIDQRCVELAAFALALTAWRYPGAGGYRPLFNLNLACSGLSINALREDWLNLAGNNPNLRMALEKLYIQFKDAPDLGSLVNPKKGLFKSTLIEVEWEKMGPLLAKALSDEKDDEKNEMGIVAQGLTKAANLLVDKYNLVITNVPYLVRGKQGETLRSYCENYFLEAKNDLATSFLDRCLDFCEENGSVNIVLPQNWLFATTYVKFREKLLKNESWRLVARLGPGAFDTISGEVVKAILIILTHNNSGFHSNLFINSKDNSNDNQLISCIDVSAQKTPVKKAALLKITNIIQIYQKNQLNNPDSRVVLNEIGSGVFLNSYADSFEGLTTGDLNRFSIKFWELNKIKNGWVKFQGSVETTILYGGREQLLFWEEGKGNLVNFPGSYIKGMGAWGKQGIRVTQLGSLACTIYSGEIFDKNAATIIPKRSDYLLPIYEYCSSVHFKEEIRKIDQRMNVMIGTMVKVPFDLDYWTKFANEKYHNGLPKPYSNDPTQWIFHGYPTVSEEPLQVAITRMLGYRWPAELENSMEISDEARTLVNRCEKIQSYVDEDGIVCIPSVRGEPSAVDRLLNFLAAAYGDAWSNDKLSELFAIIDHSGKTLETWLREKFFTQHCKLFQHRPFIWHIWDGLRDGFAALVNYHKLDHKNLEVLIYTYLGDWINHQKQDKANGVDGAAEKLDAAEVLKKRLELILEGESPYDIFVRWKPIEKQPIGWEPDLNDGIRLNIRPFMSVPDIGKKGAGVLRDKPNIDWGKDRGKDVESAPWYHRFKGDRINDYHLTLAEKKAAREASK